MARALLLVLFALTCTTVFLFIAKFWWMPPLASAAGVAMDREFAVTLFVLGIVFVMAQIGLAVFVLRVRAAGAGRYATGHRCACVALTAVDRRVFVALYLAGAG